MVDVTRRRCRWPPRDSAGAEENFYATMAPASRSVPAPRKVMRKTIMGIIVVLLVAIVGYLAMDRNDKEVADERNKAFDRQFNK